MRIGVKMDEARRVVIFSTAIASFWTIYSGGNQRKIKKQNEGLNWLLVLSVEQQKLVIKPEQL